MGLETPNEVVDELRMLGVWSAVPEFRFMCDLISRADVLPPWRRGKVG
jgi:hypothetical protein